MKFCQSILDNAVQVLSENAMTHKNSILLGDNSSGKSEILKNLIETKISNGERIYYIDAVNRYFDVSKISAPYKNIEDEKNIVATRIQSDYFNLIDTFSIYKTVTDRVELIYQLYKEKVQNLLKEFVGITFEVIRPEEKIVSTHSADLVRTAQDCNIIILYKEALEVIDANDFNSDAQVRMVFRQVFDTEENEEDEVDMQLRILLNNKITGIWNQKDEELFNSLEESSMSNAQRVLYRQIKGW